MAHIARLGRFRPKPLRLGGAGLSAAEVIAVPAASKQEPIIEIAPEPMPRSSRLLLSFGMPLVVAALLVGLAAGNDPIFLAIGIMGFGLAVWTLGRRTRLRVTGSREQLVVTNWGGTKTTPRREILRFEIITPSFGTALRQGSVVGPTVHVVLRDGSVLPLHVTGSKLPTPSVDKNLNKLNEWLGNENAT